MVNEMFYFRACTKCSEWKNFDEFRRSTTSGYADGYHTWCLSCEKVYKKDTRQHQLLTKRIDYARNRDRWVVYQKKALGGDARKKYVKTVRARWNGMKARARRRNMSCTISFEEYAEIMKQDCFYCNGKLDDVSIGAGLDRIDNSKGYESGNVLRCCRVCNTTRMANHTVDETKHMIESLLEYRNRKNSLVAI